jgi:hypothetical protein
MFEVAACAKFRLIRSCVEIERVLKIGVLPRMRLPAPGPLLTRYTLL